MNNYATLSGRIQQQRADLQCVIAEVRDCYNTVFADLAIFLIFLKELDS